MRKRLTVDFMSIFCAFDQVLLRKKARKLHETSASIYPYLPSSWLSTNPT